jgi:energy-coupling factor transporter ATP-binding protein EcfA2
VEILIGETPDPVVLDFEKNKSLLITGAHSVGKSTLIHLMLEGLFAKAEKQKIIVTLVDANRVEFSNYRNIRFVDRSISYVDQLIHFFSDFNLGKIVYDDLHFIVIDDLDFFDLKEFDNRSAEVLFQFIKAANSSRNVRLIVGCSYIENSGIYQELTTYFLSKIFFLFQSKMDLERLSGLKDAPNLGLYEYIGQINKALYSPVTFRDISDRDIYRTTTRFSISKFKEYVAQRQSEIGNQETAL